jgi:hypothetical protein
MQTKIHTQNEDCEASAESQAANDDGLDLQGMQSDILQRQKSRHARQIQAPKGGALHVHNVSYLLLYIILVVSVCLFVCHVQRLLRSEFFLL